TVPIDAIEELSPSAISMMPKGLLDTLEESDVQDLLAYLVSPPVAAKEEPAFPQRSAEEVKAALASLPAATEETDSKPIVITLVASKQDHGRGEHDYPAWQASWKQLLQTAKGVAVHNAHDWPSSEQWRDSDVLVFYFWNHDWSVERLKQLDDYLARGGGAVVLHAALISDTDPEALADRWGLAAQPKRTKYRHGPVGLLFEENKDASLLASGFSKLALVDETYWPMIGDRRKVTVLATAVEDGNEWPMLWTYQRGRGRVWASVIGHYSATLDDPLFRILVLRGIAWAADQPLHRFQSLATH
nr:ThuA domain-containing protein [Planctomycetota bacterium]